MGTSSAASIQQQVTQLQATDIRWRGITQFHITAQKNVTPSKLKQSVSLLSLPLHPQAADVSTYYQILHRKERVNARKPVGSKTTLQVCSSFLQLFDALNDTT
jgi:hypothetical protein